MFEIYLFAAPSIQAATVDVHFGERVGARRSMKTTRG
jgi:hypothetical protein